MPVHIPDPALSSLSDEDLLLACLYGEVRGEPIEGQIAVACVIRNRVSTPSQRFGDGWHDVILRWAQFSCLWSELGGKDFEAVRAFAQTISLARRAVKGLDTVAHRVYLGITPDPTHGATHYLTTALLKTKPPAWVAGATMLDEIGHHSFFNGVA